VEIADHLVRSEALYRDQIQALIQMARDGRASMRIGFDEVDSSIGGVPRDVMRLFETPMRIFNLFVPHAVRETMVRYPIMPALNPSKTHPGTGLGRAELLTDLAVSLDETESLLRGGLPANVEVPEIEHPIMGSNNLPRLLRIVIAHEERHQGQIAAIRAGFPKTDAIG
jgi:hypothetical protein